ncbi:probable RNA-dependent RNA polymerase 2 [Phoenix dactylifera]|uniref:RNA-dependent RNA polymerase n=1 Tax=Phoenix dactylifera TaxID=42345 RepID=A0A8B7BLE5_PHODC|nr:probable RNA-dependent RNA polymerase 2 [Phoenix dactylifera]
MGGVRATVQVSNIPLTAVAQELFEFFDSAVGSVFACEIATAHRNWKSRGFGRVQFDSLTAADRACLLADRGHLPDFQRARLAVRRSNEDIIVRAAEARNRVEGAALHAGVLVSERCMEMFGSWDRVRAEIMPEREKLDIFMEDGGVRYKLEITFGDILATFGCRLAGRGTDAILLQLHYAPKIYKRISGRTISSKFSNDRYHACKEDFRFLWVRATDFSSNSSIGRSCYLCLELVEGLPGSEIQKKLPFAGELGELALSMGELFYAPSKLVPIISCPPEHSVAYEILFQLNSLVHVQKISCGQVNNDLFDILRGLSLDTTMKILTRMHKLNSTCYEPMQFIKNQLANMRKNRNASSPIQSAHAENIMGCHRVLVTPSKVYFFGPELETSNYVVKHYSEYASDFIRVSFVEEDWGKLSSDAISPSIEQGLFSKPYRTGIYNRILSILRDGIVIGSKKFEFLAFSASQLRSNSVWMFASNDKVTAEGIREWMGHFNKIHSISKCAARMGQLFSSSLQTIDVPFRDVRTISDITVTTDGIPYCFSDGIGKISLSFARQVAQKCGLSHTPSAFQIRYGGYKGVIAVDRTSFQKLSLRPSMLKFESENTMLCVTKWSEYLPCYLNREIICLLSTLGIEDEVFESMQHDQMSLLDEMLTNREIALRMLDKMAFPDTRTTVKMLMQGYEPNSEPYLLMMLKAYREYQLSDIRSKCRIFVPKGRVLLGCLDETGSLDYGQIYVKVTMTKEELQHTYETCFDKVDQTAAVVVQKVVVTRNPCLHPGDVRILQAVYNPQLDNMGLVDCIVFPQKGRRPHPNECSGGDLDGDLYFVCWDEKLIPPKMDTPMDYNARRQRHTDHDVTLEEIQKFFVDYMINDTLGIISTAHLVYADSEPGKAQSPKCLELANLHSMAVDFAKTGSSAEMPRILKPKMFPDFMERWDRTMYVSTGVLGKLYRAASRHIERPNTDPMDAEMLPQSAYDHDLEIKGFEAFLEVAEDYYNQYSERLSSLMKYYGAEHEDEILTGNLRSRSMYLQRDKKKYGEMKDRILIGVKSLHKEVQGWFKSSCVESESLRMASAWYHVTYHPSYYSENRFLSFPWILSDALLSIKASKSHKRQAGAGNAM